MIITKEIDRSVKQITIPHKKDLHPGIYLNTFSRSINSLSSNKYINTTPKHENELILIRNIHWWRRKMSSL